MRTILLSLALGVVVGIIDRYRYFLGACEVDIFANVC